MSPIPRSRLALVASMLMAVIGLGVAVLPSTQLHADHGEQLLTGGAKADPVTAQVLSAHSPSSEPASTQSSARLLYALLLTFAVHRRFRSQPLLEARLRAVARRSS